MDNNNIEILLPKIQNFIKVFKQHLEFVKNAKLPKYDSLYKKIICVGIIDTLSKTVYPDVRSNKSRFTNFLLNYSKSELWNKVSLAHLIRLLSFTENSKFLKLEQYAKSTLGTSDSPAEPRATYIDPDFEIIEKLWPKDIQELKGVKLYSFKHINLFYKYRNYIVHELRRPGGLVDDDIHHNIPFYYSLLSNNSNYFWKLVYPLGFFVDVCQIGLNNVEVYYKLNAVNPYEVFDRGDYLISNLN